MKMAVKLTEIQKYRLTTPISFLVLFIAISIIVITLSFFVWLPKKRSVDVTLFTGSADDNPLTIQSKSDFETLYSFPTSYYDFNSEKYSGFFRISFNLPPKIINPNVRFSVTDNFKRNIETSVENKNGYFKINFKSSNPSPEINLLLSNKVEDISIAFLSIFLEGNYSSE